MQQKKEKLLLEIRKSFDDGTLIDLIATDLRISVADRMDIEKLKNTKDLYNEIGKFEQEEEVFKMNLRKKKNKNYTLHQKVNSRTIHDVNKTEELIKIKSKY